MKPGVGRYLMTALVIISAKIIVLKNNSSVLSALVSTVLFEPVLSVKYVFIQLYNSKIYNREKNLTVIEAPLLELKAAHGKMMQST